MELPARRSRLSTVQSSVALAKVEASAQVDGEGGWNYGIMGNGTLGERRPCQSIASQLAFGLGDMSRPFRMGNGEWGMDNGEWGKVGSRVPRDRRQGDAASCTPH